MFILIASDSPSISTKIRKALALYGHECPITHLVGLDQLPSLLQSAATGVDLIFVLLPAEESASLGMIRRVRTLTTAQLVAVGSSVAAQPPTELFVLVPRQPLVVRADIEQDFVERVHPGMSAEVVDEVAPDKVYAAKVERLGDMFGRRSGSAEAGNERQDVRVLDCILVLKDGALRVGQRVLVRFVAGT